ncbi:NAD(P)/FAD-dependent oxidoreductase [Fodinisporobacter ferrooxydans]|uniref:NAD(P)/FAD-dependent oxidoreductase n=2 Tax=Fodinisporobacter ferrooxydans TaxID=2901836 RepID=A0ABY4CT82_9BACL|nr:NAD(P)/FAD-dependent oxidoreductase [Alicyclobacillaceae bacterium MYW30-H2]
MAAIAAARHGASVMLVEKGNRLGRKLLISGGGRCNVTNAKELPELIRNIPGNGKFMHSSLHNFGNRDIIRFFEELGIALKEEDRGRMFPVTDKAKTVLDALLSHLAQLQVRILLDQPVKRLLFDANAAICQGVELQGHRFLYSHGVVVAVGGCSVPKTGSTGDGYAWAKAAGHTIVPPFPTEVGITAEPEWLQLYELQGLSLRDIELTVYNPKGKKLTTEFGDMIFTHFGISGPAAFRCSHYVVTAQQKFGRQTLQTTLDLFPGLSKDTLTQQIVSLCRQHPKKTLRNLLKSFLPDRLIPCLLQSIDLDGNRTYDHLPKHGVPALADACKAWAIPVTGTLPLEQATVTGGGVSIKEIDPKTMQSKQMQGLFFAGEIMDVHAHTGGYNITVAFSSGYTAGQHAANLAKGKE